MNTETTKPVDLRTEAALELENDISALVIGCEKANLMLNDLMNSLFWKYPKGLPSRETLIIRAFNENRIRAEILFDILVNVQETVDALDRKNAKNIN